MTSEEQFSPIQGESELVNVLSTENVGQENVLVEKNEAAKSKTLACYPNPFHTSTTIAYTLPENATIRLTVQDLNGRLVQELVNTTQLKGNHQIGFDGSDLPAGMYLVQLQTKHGVQTTKLSLVR